MKQEYWRYARCKYAKMELKYHIFWEKYETWKKSIFEHFFRTRKSKNSVFWGSEVEVEILEKIEKNRKLIRGGRVSWGNHPKPFFRSLGGPLRSIWVVYQPRTTIFDEVMLQWSWDIFGWFPGNRILVDVWICDISGEKLTF